MSWQRQAIYWAVVLLGFLLFLYVFSGILLPFIAGMILAYVLDPLADRFEAMGLGRLSSTVVILVIFLVIFVLALLVILPLLGKQLTEFIQQIPNYIKALQAFLVSDWVKMVTSYLPITVEDLQSNLGNFVDDGARWATKILGSVLSGGQAILNLLSVFVITPIVAFYLLYDWDRMIAAVNGWLPREHAPTIRRLASEMSDMIAGFIRAQGLICLLLGLFYAACLTLMGLNFGLLIGFGIGLISFIPFVGAVIGVILSVGVALAQYLPGGEYLMILLVIAIFAAGQFIEGNILQPWLLGNHVQLHPVWLMFALFAFGSLFGFVGMLIAVPVAACIGVLTRFGLQQYLSSELYLGDANAGAANSGEDSSPRTGA